MSAEFDYYSATIDDDTEVVIGELLAALSWSSIRSARAMHGYKRGWEVYRGDDVLARVWAGGNPGVHVQASGYHSPAVAKCLKTRFPGHRVSRVDGCADWIQAGLFDRLAGHLRRFATEHGIALNFQGDWERGQARTLYVGARGSAAQLVLYEKGYEIGGNPDLVRLEARIRPEKREQKAKAARWETAEACFTGARWLVQCMHAIGWDHLVPDLVTRPYKPSDALRARAALCRAYGAVLRAWADELGEDGLLGPAVFDFIEQQARNDARMRDIALRGASECETV